MDGATPVSESGTFKHLRSAWIGALVALLICGASAATLSGANTSKIYVTNQCTNAVTAYPASSNGDVAPLSPVTGLGQPSGIALDLSGRIFVANTCSYSVTVYAAGSNGDAGPVAGI